ncbi:MAG: hypothetical protein DRN91_06625 [Candidatus Alkanophagales archaeon]|nr:MAG: hypothetical protein DRN91_06625 [Candidatus Alkanophagales archaeon]
MGYGWRWMFRLTGLPGWLRFGFSPGWLGRSPTGLPPAASYLMQTGQLPQFLSYLQTQQPSAPMPPWAAPLMGKEQEIEMLEAQAKALEEALSQIKKRLEELQK